MRRDIILKSVYLLNSLSYLTMSGVILARRGFTFVILTFMLLVLDLNEAEFDFAFESERKDDSNSKTAPLGIYKNGTFIIGGLFPIHFESTNTGNHTLQCSGRFNHRGYETAKAMMYAIETINSDKRLLPGITLGADIKETCNSVDFAVRNSLNFSFITRNIKASMCTVRRLNERDKSLPDTIAIIGPGVSDIAIAVTNLVGLFHVPVIDFSSTSRLLNNRIRFKYFFRTVSSDVLLSKAIVDLIVKLGWNIIHVLYSDTDYGRSAMETFEYVLAQTQSKICKASKGIFNIHSSENYLNKVVQNIKREARSKVIVLFTTIQDLELILGKFMKENMTEFVFISPDYFSGSIQQFKCSPEMLRRVIGIVPHSEDLSIHNISHSFDVVLNDTFGTSQWQEEYEHMKRVANGSMRFCHSLYVPYVVDAVYAVAHALHDMLGCSSHSCKVKPEQFGHLNR